MYNTYRCPSFMLMLSFGEERKSQKMANVIKNKRRKEIQDRALFGYLGQNRRMETFITYLVRSPCGGFVLRNQKMLFLEFYFVRNFV